MSIKNNFPEIKPSLNLDFANVKKLDPRVTFSRASEGRYYDGVTTAKAEENLIFPSQGFGFSGVWGAVGTATAVANNATAPDGTTTATTITTTGAGGARYNIGFNSKTLTISCWVRSVSGDTSFQTDFSNGFVGSLTLTGSWQRHVSTVTTSTGQQWIDFQIAGTGVFEIWGVQLEERSAVTAYTPTTSQPITNYIPVLQTASANVARFDHDPVTGESLGLLVEEQRTNLLTYSEDFAYVSWGKNNSSVLSNQMIAPDGTLTMDKIVITATNGNIARIVSLTGTYTTSVFFKKGEINWARITYDTNATKTAWFDLENGVLGTVRNGTATITDVGNGVYRCSFAATDVTSLVVTGAANDDQTDYTGDGYSGIYIWGAQLEAGAFPTSYIPTTTSQVTRSADAASMTGANFSEWYRQDEGTLFADVNTSPDNIVGYASISTSTYTQNSIYLDSSGVGAFRGIVFSNSSIQAVIAGATGKTAGSQQKTAFSYKVNDFAISTSGATVVSDTSGNVPLNLDRFFIGSLAGNEPCNTTIRKIAYYPQRLSNTNLQALTS